MTTNNNDEIRAKNYARIKKYLQKTGKRQYSRIVLPEYIPKLDALLKELRNDKKSNKETNCGTGTVYAG